MKTWKKVGLTALAGSLMAVSAQADWSVSGSGVITYTDGQGAGADNQDTGLDGDRFGTAQDFSVSASTELDNGFTVGISHGISAGAQDATTLSVDMGEMGKLKYSVHDGTIGLSAIDNKMPTAHEEVFNGVATSGSVGAGATGFNYTNSLGDMVSIGIGLVSKAGTAATGNGTGGESGAGSGASQPSYYAIITPADGLTLGFGAGEYQDAAGSNTTDDHNTMYVTYAYGPVTAGIQLSEIDDANAANVDIDQEAFGIAYAVNDNFSISYGEIEADYSTTSVNEETKGWSAAYTMGAMTVSLHSNETKANDGVAANGKLEHTELSLAFAF
jgi:hypothetical protein